MALKGDEQSINQRLLYLDRRLGEWVRMIQAGYEQNRHRDAQLEKLKAQVAELLSRDRPSN